MILRILFTAAVVCTVALVFFLLGRETERRAIHRRLRSAGSSRVAYTALDAVVREVQEDSAEVMREMEFYGEAAEVVNCRTTGRA